jgi:hypothetical protein
MSGERNPHGLSQAIFDDGAVEADFPVDAPWLGDRVEVIAGLAERAEGLPHRLEVRGDPGFLLQSLPKRAIRLALGWQSG